MNLWTLSAYANLVTLVLSLLGAVVACFADRPYMALAWGVLGLISMMFSVLVSAFASQVDCAILNHARTDQLLDTHIVIPNHGDCTILAENEMQHPDGQCPGCPECQPDHDQPPECLPGDEWMHQ
jgi:hypothetical protein